MDEKQVLDQIKYQLNIINELFSRIYENPLQLNTIDLDLLNQKVVAFYDQLIAARHTAALKSIEMINNFSQEDGYKLNETEEEESAEKENLFVEENLFPEAEHHNISDSGNEETPETPDEVSVEESEPDELPLPAEEEFEDEIYDDLKNEEIFEEMHEEMISEQEEEINTEELSDEIAENGINIEAEAEVKISDIEPETTETEIEAEVTEVQEEVITEICEETSELSENEPESIAASEVIAPVHDEPETITAAQEAEVIPAETHAQPDEDKSVLVPENEASEEKEAEEVAVDLFGNPIKKDKTLRPSYQINLGGQDSEKENEKKALYEKFIKPELSINERMAGNSGKVALADKIQKGPISDIRAAITLNMKLSFIRELFEGDQKEYKRVIDFLSKCQNLSEAKLFMQEEMGKRPHWNKKQALIDSILELIHRRFQ